MADLYHEMGGDLALSPTGDLALVSGAVATRQRVLRRLLTNPLGYVWHPEYGAGLARFVGLPIAAVAIQAVIEQQLQLEQGVAPDPPPSTDVTGAADGTMRAIVRYADQNGSVQVMGVPI